MQEVLSVCLCMQEVLSVCLCMQEVLSVCLCMQDVLSVCLCMCRRYCQCVGGAGGIVHVCVCVCLQEVASREVKRTILRTTFSRTARAIDAVDGGEVGREHIFHEQVTLKMHTAMHSQALSWRTCIYYKTYLCFIVHTP